MVRISDAMKQSPEELRMVTRRGTIKKIFLKALQELRKSPELLVIAKIREAMKKSRSISMVRIRRATKKPRRVTMAGIRGKKNEKSPNNTNDKT